VKGPLEVAVITGLSGSGKSTAIHALEDLDYYCIDNQGRIRFWSHNGTTDESWKNLATWIEDVWIGEN